MTDVEQRLGAGLLEGSWGKASEACSCENLGQGRGLALLGG
jgi:hypothetical protein